MKNIFLFPTNSKPQHIYITSDEKPKKGEWSIYLGLQKKYKVIEDIVGDEFPKIILTTDPDLIKDGVQAIDYEFLQWFVNNPNCERVDFFKLEYSEYSNSKCLKCGFIENHDKVDTEDCPKCSNTTYEHFYNQYKLIIPKEETIEEDAENYSKITLNKGGLMSNKQINGFIAGAKWQAERMYSEEEVLNIIKESRYSEFAIDDLSLWFEQFKKK